MTRRYRVANTRLTPLSVEARASALEPQIVAADDKQE
jgi:hypothetical protein